MRRRAIARRRQEAAGLSEVAQLREQLRETENRLQLAERQREVAEANSNKIIVYLFIFYSTIL